MQIIGEVKAMTYHKEFAATPEMLRKMDMYWRAANYLAAGQPAVHSNC